MAGLISDDHLMNGMMNHGSPLSGSGPFDQPKTPLNPFGDEGIECEQYAVKLDELLPEKGADAETVWSRAMQLAREYHSMARSTLDSLQRQRGIATAAQSGSRREVEDVNMDLQELEDTRSPTGADDLARLNETIRDWQLESQTWDIFESMSSELYSKPQRDRSSTKVPQDQLLNSSLPTSEQQLQKLFFLGDDRARTRAIVLEWLKRSAASERDSIDDTLDKWASQADQNINIVSQGWLDTREEIKRQKRSTGQVGPIALQNAGQSFDGTNGTITQLDPDAITRQQRSLQPADQAYESYVWMGCYEMLRRGQSWEEIRQWCQDKKEGWRAVSMGGEAIDWDWSVSNLDSTQHLVVSDSYSQAGSQGSNARLKSRFLWRVMCLATARRSGGNAYERASYGILSGDLTVVKAVSTDWNDALFAHLNASLHQGFTTFVATNYPTLLPDSTALRGLRLEDDTTPSAGSEEMSSLADRLRRSMTLADDIDSPFKNIQAAIISDSIGSEVARLTETILLSSFKAQPSTNGHRQSLMNHKPSYPTNGEPSSAAPNAQLLRVLVHVALLHNLLTHKNRTSHTQDEGVAQLIELYVKHLHSDGKLDMIPLYASLLPESKQKLLLGSIVIRIGDRLSKENFLNLMELNGMDVKAVVTEEIRRSISELKFPDLNDTRASPFIKCLVDDVNDSSEVGCGVKNIELGTELDTEDLILIQSLEWLLYIDGVLAETFERGADLYAYFYSKSDRELWHKDE